MMRRSRRLQPVLLEVLEERQVLSGLTTFTEAANGQAVQLRRNPTEFGTAADGSAVQLRGPQGSSLAAELTTLDWSVPAGSAPDSSAGHPVGAGLLEQLNAARVQRRLGDLLASSDSTLGGLVATPRGLLLTQNSPTGSSLVLVDRDGQPRLLYRAAAGQQLHGVAALRNGLTLVASAGALEDAGSILILDARGVVRGSIQDPVLVQHPMALAAREQGRTIDLFVANAGGGTVSRIGLANLNGRLRQLGGQTLATGYTTGGAGLNALAYDTRHDTLYVAWGTDGAVSAVEQATARSTPETRGRVVIQDRESFGRITGLLVLADGNLVASGNSPQGWTSRLAEYTRTGSRVELVTIARTPNAALGLTLNPPGTPRGLTLVQADGTAQVLEQVLPRRPLRGRA